MDNNESNTQHRFIFNDSFYDSLNQASNNLPPQRDLLAPIGEQVKTEINMPEQLNEVKVNISKPIEEVVEIPKIEIPSIIEEPQPEITVEEIPQVNEIVIEEPEVEIETPTLEKNQIDEPVSETKMTEIEIPALEKVEVEETIPEIKVTEIEEKPREENKVDTLLQVNTGIDKNLENEVLNEYRKEEPEFVYRPVVEEPKPRNVYRAVRRPRINLETTNINNTTNTTSQNTNSEVVPIRHIEKVPNTPPQKMDNTWVPPYQPQPIIIKEEINYYEEEKVEVTKSDLLEKLRKQEEKTGKVSILARYGEDFCSRDYVTNPAIGRNEEMKDLGLILLTPDKSAILVGKPGIGKTSIVEGFAYKLQRNQVPEALKGYTIISIKTASLLGTLPNGETRLQTLVDELKSLDKIILFIDEIHMLMNATADGTNLDFANLFKESLGRGSIKMIGATTSEEYERYVLRDKAFVRRFQRIDVLEPTPEVTVEIIMGTLPKIEANTGAKMMYTHYIQVEIMKYIVSITSEYKRIYGIGSRYPDICLTLITQAFSEAIFDNRKEVNIKDIRNAILKSKNIYPDVIKKEIINFDKQFKELLEEAK